MSQTKWKPLLDFIEQHQCDWSMQPPAPQRSGLAHKPDTEQWGIHHQDTPPHNRLLGPVFERGKTTGLLIQGDQTLCHWGDVNRAGHDLQRHQNLSGTGGRCCV